MGDTTGAGTTGAAAEQTLKHKYHAEATALSGSLKLPLKKAIDPQASAVLSPEGGYLSQKTGEFRLEGVVTYKAAHTQVSGMPGVKPGHGPATLTTSVVEGLNILEILTVDRLVAQISTEHPLVGHTPEISFLGTRFENIRIAGHPVHVHLDIGMVGHKPAADGHYLHEPSFKERIAKQCQTLRAYEGLPDAARERYTGTAIGDDEHKAIQFSLVTATSGDFPGKSFGHVIHVPNFGTIYLATVKIHHEITKEKVPQTTVELTMVEAKLGCIGDGNVNGGSGKTNGGNGG
jgi:hypothetical protein